ncbi:MAG: sulfotransferase [Actinomycetes bacterium]
MASRDANKPNFIYIGPDKAGSSWLHECLLTHPQVFMPVAKDLYFFDRYYDRGLAWYLSQFADAGPQQEVVGEVCQDYLFCPEAPERIEESLGTARFMVTLRDPADRAFSSYLYMLKQGQTPGTFLQALERRPELIEHGRYATGISRFVDRFGAEQLYVAVFDDLVADPQAFIDALLTWLGIDPLTLSDELLGARLPAARARSTLLARWARRAADVVRERDGANVVGRVKRSPAVQKLLYKELADDKPVMSDEERAAVHQALGEEVAALDRTYGLGLARRWGWSLSQSTVLDDSGS